MSGKTLNFLNSRLQQLQPSFPFQAPKEGEPCKKGEGRGWGRIPSPRFFFVWGVALLCLLGCRCVYRFFVCRQVGTYIDIHVRVCSLSLSLLSLSDLLSTWSSDCLSAYLSVHPLTCPFSTSGFGF